MAYVSFSVVATLSYTGNKKEKMDSFCSLKVGMSLSSLIKLRCLIFKTYDQKLRITEYA